RRRGEPTHDSPRQAPLSRAPAPRSPPDRRHPGPGRPNRTQRRAGASVLRQTDAHTRTDPRSTPTVGGTPRWAPGGTPRQAPGGTPHAAEASPRTTPPGKRPSAGLRPRDLRRIDATPDRVGRREPGGPHPAPGGRQRSPGRPTPARGRPPAPPPRPAPLRRSARATRRDRSRRPSAL